MTRALLIFLAVILSACATDDRGSKPLVAPGETIVWPKYPETPRIKFLYAFSDSKELGFPTSFFGNLLNLLGGEEEKGMVRPYAIAADEDMILIADPGFASVHLFDMKKKEYSRIGKFGDNVLVSPVGVSMGPESLFVTDSALGKVYVLDREGKLKGTIDELQRPTGIAYEASSGRLYVSDTLEHIVAVFDKNGKRLFTFGKRGVENGEFNYPTHLYLRDGKLTVNDAMNFRLQTFDREGKHLLTFGSHGDATGYFSSPKGVARDDDGNFYVVDALFNAVQIFNSKGKYLLSFGKNGSGAGDMWLPSGLFIKDNQIYVADSFNQRVQVFQYLGGE